MANVKAHLCDMCPMACGWWTISRLYHGGWLSVCCIILCHCDCVVCSLSVVSAVNQHALFVSSSVYAAQSLSFLAMHFCPPHQPSSSVCPSLQSTLMKAIAAGKLDGFPPADQLRTVYVEHDIQAAAAEYSVLEFVCKDDQISAMKDNTETHVSNISLGTRDILHMISTSSPYRYRSYVCNPDAIAVDSMTSLFVHAL